MTNDDINEFFRSLRNLRSDCSGKMSSEDKLAVLITACIDFGFDTRERLIGTLRRLGFNNAQVAKALDRFEGGQWRLAEDGRYINMI